MRVDLLGSWLPDAKLSFHAPDARDLAAAEIGTEYLTSAVKVRTESGRNAGRGRFRPSLTVRDVPVKSAQQDHETDH